MLTIENNRLTSGEFLSNYLRAFGFTSSQKRFSEASFRLIEGAWGERSGGADGGNGGRGSVAARGPYALNNVDGLGIGGGVSGGGGRGVKL